MKIEIGIEIEMINGANNEEVAKALPKPMMGNDENDKAWTENNGIQGSDVSVRADGTCFLDRLWNYGIGNAVLCHKRSKLHVRIMAD